MFYEEALQVGSDREIYDVASVHLHEVGELVMTDNRAFQLPAFTWLWGTRDQFVVGFASVDTMLADDPSGKDSTPEAAGFNRGDLDYA